MNKDKLNVKKFSLAIALTLSLIYVVCAIFVVLWPYFSLQLFGWLMHLVNVDKFAGDMQITAVGFIIGLVQMFVYTYVVALVFGWMHNKFMDK